MADGQEFCCFDLSSGCQGFKSTQDAFEGLLSFLGAAAESYRCKGLEGENAQLFDLPIVDWAAKNADELAMLELELEETSNLIEE